MTITRGASRRLFRTVLFTDIVGSTELAAEAGDKKWRRTVAAHNKAIREELRRHGGREVDTAGDGFFAIFENPTDAVRCAAAAVAAVHSLGLRIRAGVHTGEVEPSGAKFGGMAVHIGARLMSLAGAREVIASSTVRELVVGSGHEFEDRGTHELKGVPGEWHVYSLVMPRFEEGVPLVGVDDEELRAVTSRRQRLVVVALVAVIALLIATLGGAYYLGSRAAPPPSGANSLAVYDTTSTTPLRGWSVGQGPHAVAVAEGVAWVASTDSGTLARINLATGELNQVGQVGTRPTSVAATAQRVWVADRFSNRLTVLDARQGNLIEPLSIHASGLASSAGQLWVADDLGDRIIRIDPGTNVVQATVDLPTPAGPSGIAIAGGYVWIAAPRQNAVFRVASAEGLLQPIPVDVDDLRTISAQGDDVWLAGQASDTVVRLEAGSGRVAVRVEVCDAPVGIAATPTGAWVVCAHDRQLWHIDRAGTIVTRITLDAVPSSVAADGERALVTLRAD